MTLFTEPITPDDVAELIDFTVPGNPETESMAMMQRKGVAALYNILCDGPVAYLADEVGMGKTYQALALAALAWNQKPHARILFVSPRQNLQEKWVDDYGRFFASNYRREHEMGDDRVTSALFGEPVHRAMRFDNLRSWTPTIGMPERIAPFLRHTSFMRPVFLKSTDLTGDMDQLWRNWQERFKGWALFDSRRPKALTADSASWELNLAFARALNRKLAGEAASEEPYFDLVVVDEAQCLRHPDNQTNSVLERVLRGQVAKWLFMSATPAHGGPRDIPTVVNHYADCTVLDPELANDLPRMKDALGRFMVRRQRRYITGDRRTEVGKSEYRDHDKEQWAVKDADMSALSTLAMGLVQKGLVDVLESRNNRYRTGFLSSFESLQSSLRPIEATAGDSTAVVRERPPDFEHDPTEVPRDERNAPDADFIDQLAEDFQARFDMPLPHAKVDSVVDLIAPLAFGSNDEVGGHKFLIFTRRVSTVHALRDRLARRHRLAVEERLCRYWNVQQLDWAGDNTDVDDLSDDEGAADSESHDDDVEGDPLRRATAKGGWLHRYRQTFRASGRNSLFFEDGWLERLCRAGGKDPMEAAKALPDDIWAESWSHAAKAAGAGRQFRANRLRYLAVQGVRRVPEVFGLSAAEAEPWRVAYETCLHNHLERAKVDAEPHHAHDLFQWPTLWTAWDAAFGGTPCSLPANDPRDVHGVGGRDDVCRRQVARTILGQTFRLTDTLLDLYCADEAVGRSSDKLAERFLDWLTSKDPGAVQVRNDCARWLEHLRLIVDGCLDAAGRPWHELVHEQEESWAQLFEPGPVFGVTGGSGGHRRAVRQFRTPSLPRVIVCTDTLKEGVDLHLFCDHVLHYGVAWTSGDMEQRVGRVDRYFSQIERRLAGEGTPPDVKLHVGYPHVVASLERGQVERVIQRQKDVEALMDSPLAGTVDDEREHGVDALVRAPSSRSDEEPFGELRFPKRRRRIVAVAADAARADIEHYVAWYGTLRRRLRERGWRIGGDGSMPDDVSQPARRATLMLSGADRQHELEWGFDAALKRYVMTLASPPWPTDGMFSGGERRRIVGRERLCQTFVRLLVPTPDEGLDETVITALADVLASAEPRPNARAQAYWGEALADLSPEGVDWVSGHKARLLVRRGERAQRVAVYAYEGSVRAVSVVSARLDNLGPRSGWRQPPSADDVQDWILGANNNLPLGYLDLHERDGLVFGIHVLHGDLSADARRRLLEEVGWRADSWEASLTGTDRH